MIKWVAYRTLHVACRYATYKTTEKKELKLYTRTRYVQEQQKYAKKINDTVRTKYHGGSEKRLKGVHILDWAIENVANGVWKNSVHGDISLQYEVTNVADYALQSNVQRIKTKKTALDG